ncbi:hypothetical protein EMIT0111MI5_290026 [Burkholderia sp. IT-111MI5]
MFRIRPGGQRIQIDAQKLCPWGHKNQSKGRFCILRATKAVMAYNVRRCGARDGLSLHSRTSRGR